jgi:tetratricopeptide (TPR) repeat protein
VEAYASRGLAYAGKKDINRAIASYTESIRLNPNYAEWVYSSRARAYVEKGDYDRAIADCNQAIRLDPNNYGAYNNRAAAYFEKGDYDRSLADINQAIRLNPNDSTYLNRGLIYYEKKEYDKAIADWESVLKIAPNNAVARNNLEAVRKELNSNSSGVSGDAEAYYNKGVESMYICINLVKNLDRSNNQKFKEDMVEFETSYRSSIDAFTKAIKINPDYAEAYRTRGELYKMRNQKKEANADFKAAEKIEKKLKKKK